MDDMHNELRAWINEAYNNWIPDKGVKKTVTSFGEWLGVSNFQIRFMLKHGTIPKLESMHKIAQKLGDEVYRFTAGFRPYVKREESDIWNPAFHAWINARYEEWSPDEVGVPKSRTLFAKWLGVGEFTARYMCTYGHVPSMREKAKLATKLGDDIFKFHSRNNERFDNKKAVGTDKQSGVISEWLLDHFKRWQPEKGVKKTLSNYSLWLGKDISSVSRYLLNREIPSRRALLKIASKLEDDTILDLVDIVSPRVHGRDTKFSQYMREKYESWVKESDGDTSYKAYGRLLGVEPPLTIRSWIYEGSLAIRNNREIIYKKLGAKALKALDESVDDAFLATHGIDRTLIPQNNWYFEKYNQWEPENGEEKTLPIFAAKVRIKPETIKKIFYTSEHPKGYLVNRFAELLSPPEPGKTYFQQWIIGKYSEWENEQKEAGLIATQGQFANYLGISRKTVGNYFTGVNCCGDINSKILVDKLGPYWF